MNDYIKREDAIRAMAKYMMDLAHYDNPVAEAAGIIEDRIEQWEGNIAAPVMSMVKAADVVEVVRCRDCKHQRKNGNVYSCDLNDGYSHVCLDEDYCSYGERAGA